MQGTSGLFSKPGVVGGWREDLQGKQRPDYMQLQQNRDIFVTTSYGQVFLIHLHLDALMHIYEYECKLCNNCRFKVSRSTFMINWTQPLHIGRG